MDAKKIKWESYKDDVQINIEAVPQNILLVQDAELATAQFEQAILFCYHQNHEARIPRCKKESEQLSARTRLFNGTKRMGH
jgi:hypothetical protein